MTCLFILLKKSHMIHTLSMTYVERIRQNLIRVYCIRNDTINWCTCDLVLYNSMRPSIDLCSSNRYIKRCKKKKKIMKFLNFIARENVIVSWLFCFFILHYMMIKCFTCNARRYVKNVS